MHFSLIISRLCEPFFVIFPLIIVLAVMQSGMQGDTVYWFFTVLGLVFFLPSALGMIYMVTSKKITNWDVSDRRQRIKVLSIFLALIAVASVIIQKFGNVFMTHFLEFFLLWFAGFFLQTFIYKISGHVGMLTLAVGIIIHWYGWSWWPIIILIPLLSWARLILKRHTIREVVGAGIYSTLILFLGIYFAII